MGPVYKVHCSTREFRDEPLPLMSDIPFFKALEKYPKAVNLIH